MFMDNYIVTHDLNNFNIIVIKIDSIEAIVNNKDNGREHAIIHTHNMIFSVYETMETIIRRLQKGANDGKD